MSVPGKLHGSSSGYGGGDTDSPFPDPSMPAAPPFSTVPVPDHFSTTFWQETYYEPTSDAPASLFVKLPSGSISPDTGRLTGPFHPGSKHWKQV